MVKPLSWRNTNPQPTDAEFVGAELSPSTPVDAPNTTGTPRSVINGHALVFGVLIVTGGRLAGLFVVLRYVGGKEEGDVHAHRRRQLRHHHRAHASWNGNLDVIRGDNTWYPDHMDAATLLARTRRRAGLTQRELARRAGTSAAAVCLYESGQRIPRVDTLTRLIAATDANIELRASGAAHIDTSANARTLEDLLELADHLPRRNDPDLSAPIFAEVAEGRP